jgi:hypothetical protein
MVPGHARPFRDFLASPAAYFRAIIDGIGQTYLACRQ